MWTKRNTIVADIIVTINIIPISIVASGDLHTIIVIVAEIINSILDTNISIIIDIIVILETIIDGIIHIHK